MTKVMFILSSVSNGLDFWSVNHTSTYENSKLKVFKNIKIYEILSEGLTSSLWVSHALLFSEFINVVYILFYNRC